MLLICEKESQFQNSWNHENKYNLMDLMVVSQPWSTNVKLYVLHLFKQLTMFNGGSWSLINKGIFYRAIFSFKMFIFNVSKKIIWQLQ